MTPRMRASRRSGGRNEPPACRMRTGIDLQRALLEKGSRLEGGITGRKDLRVVAGASAWAFVASRSSLYASTAIDGSQ